MEKRLPAGLFSQRLGKHLPLPDCQGRPWGEKASYPSGISAYDRLPVFSQNMACGWRSMASCEFKSQHLACPSGLFRPPRGQNEITDRREEGCLNRCAHSTPAARRACEKPRPPYYRNPSDTANGRARRHEEGQVARRSRGNGRPAGGIDNAGPRGAGRLNMAGGRATLLAENVDGLYDIDNKRASSRFRLGHAFLIRTIVKHRMGDGRSGQLL